jgi:predicted transposase/invertase (TIGR01784 family)
MRFINPKTGFGFKRIFGSLQSHGILVSFLNSILYEGEGRIVSLEILNPYQAPRVKGMKDSYLDVKARLNDESTVIIEMQVLNVEGFEKRVLYNAAKAYSIQLGTGEDYSLLNPVIALTITDFTMFSEEQGYLSRFILKEKATLLDYPSHGLELVFIELPKFDRELAELSTQLEQWLFFLKNARQLEAIPRGLEESPEIRAAFEIANEVNLSADELEELENREIFIHDQRNAIKLALKQGEATGRATGREEGRGTTGDSEGTTGYAGGRGDRASDGIVRERDPRFTGRERVRRVVRLCPAKLMV